MKVAILALFCFICTKVNAQPRALTFQDAEKRGISNTVLDKQYSNALDGDTIKSVFKGADKQRFFDAYVALLTDMNTFMHAHNYTWGKPTRIIHRIYFEADGTIDHYLLNFNKSGIDDAKQSRFINLLNQFVSNYKFKITAGKKFAQCGPAIYQD
jgi:hypothetical protein